MMTNRIPTKGRTKLYGYPGLACAIIDRAVRDAKSSNGVRADALDFLQSDGAASLVANLGDALGMALNGGELRGVCEALGEGQR